MLKPSKLTPATNAVLASMFSELFPEEQVAMVSGDGSAFSSLPFDHLVFTGSTAVGRAVMKAASENLVPVTLELGGKSPTIVAKDSVQNRTVSAIVWGKLLSGGQTCIAPDYAPVHESEINTFIESYDRLVKAAYPDGPISKDYTSIVNDQQYSMLVDPRGTDHRGRTPARRRHPSPFRQPLIESESKKDLASSGAASRLKSSLDARSVAIDILLNDAGYALQGDFPRPSFLTSKHP